ncbi:MAG: hypothetical protein FWF70_00210, partial [Bacteroidetes bacterium]|nr:hypothetical protein [Bacteroidota bacterium]
SNDEKIMRKTNIFSIKIRDCQHKKLLALNVPAAWRRRGFHCCSDGRKTSKFAQTFGRATAPLAPNRPLAVRCSFFILHLF